MYLLTDKVFVEAGTVISTLVFVFTHEKSP